MLNREYPNKFPEIRLEKVNGWLRFESYIRKKHRGKWYLCKNYFHMFMLKDHTDFDTLKYYRAFVWQCYGILVHGNIKDQEQKFFLDPDQRDEKELHINPFGQKYHYETIKVMEEIKDKKLEV